MSDSESMPKEEVIEAVLAKYQQLDSHVNCHNLINRSVCGFNCFAMISKDEHIIQDFSIDCLFELLVGRLVFPLLRCVESSLPAALWFPYHLKRYFVPLTSTNRTQYLDKQKVTLSVILNVDNLDITTSFPDFSKNTFT